jgi:hypothetical protein
VSLIWRRRQQLPIEVISIVTGATLSILALTMPLFSQDMTLRLALIAVLPGILVLCFAMQQISNPDAVEISDCRNYAEVFVIEQKQWFLHRIPPPPLIRSARTIPAVSEIVHDGKYFKLIRADIAHNLTRQGKE